MKLTLMLIVLVSISFFFPKSAEAQDLPGNELLAELVTAANRCIRDDMLASPPKGTLIEYWFCLGLAERVHEIRGWYGVSRPGPVPGQLDAAVSTTFAAHEIVHSLWGSDSTSWKTDVLMLLDLSDAYVMEYSNSSTVANASSTQENSSRNYNTMVAAALRVTNNCMTLMATTIQTSLGPGAEWSMGRCILLIDAMHGFLSDWPRTSELPQDLANAASVVETAASMIPSMTNNGWDTVVAGDVLILTAEADDQIDAWEEWTCGQVQSDIYPCPWSQETS